MTIANETIERLVAAYENLSPDRIEALLDCYAANAIFQDPFNDVRGRSAIGSVFRHMFATVQSPTFVVTGRFIGDHDEAVLRWQFEFRSANDSPRRQIIGLSALRFDTDGLVVEHRDYWDPAASLYQDIPLLGWVLRRLRQRLSAPGSSSASLR